MFQVKFSEKNFHSKAKNLERRIQNLLDVSDDDLPNKYIKIGEALQAYYDLKDDVEKANEYITFKRLGDFFRSDDDMQHDRYDSQY
jgi:hypothetical protein